jgi:hypothetical protein
MSIFTDVTEFAKADEDFARFVGCTYMQVLRVPHGYSDEIVDEAVTLAEAESALFI